MTEVAQPRASGVTIVPVTADRWDDLAALFGRGVVKDCWCMWFRLTNAECKAGWGAGNREMLRELVEAGQEPGLLGYAPDGTPIGWVSVAPREEFLPRLEHSRHLKPVPGERIWSVLCFWIKPGHRRQGLAMELLHAAVDYARAHGAAAVEGAPIDPGGKRAATGSSYTGVVSMFAAAGFTEIDRRGDRPIYRLTFPATDPATRPG